MMMAGPFAILALVASLLGGGPNDLLDYLSTQDYWKAKGVEVGAPAMEAELAVPATADLSALIKDLGSADFQTRESAQQKIEAAGAAAIGQLQPALKSADPEVVSRAQAIIEHLGSASHARDVRRLMAIRTLGELKDQGALKLLQPLLASKDLFVADYAAAAIAAIEGKPYARPGPSVAERAADLGLLPADVGAVGQLHVAGGTDTKGLEATITQAAEAMNQPKEQVSAMIAQGLIQAAELVGNVRIDSVTLGVADSIADRPAKGYVVVMARGVYDRKAVAALLTKGAGPQQQAREENGVQIISSSTNANFLLPSDQQLIVILGPSNESLPIPALLGALKTGRGGFAQNAALNKVVQTVDTTKPIWAAMVISDNYRQAPILAPFDALTLTTEVKTKPQGIAFKISATGSDKDKTAAAVDKLNGDIQKAIAQMQQMQQMMQGQMGGRAAMFGPILETMQSIKVVADGANATMTGSASGLNPLGVILPMFWFRAAAMHRAAPVQAGPPPAQTPNSVP